MASASVTLTLSIAGKLLSNAVCSGVDDDLMGAAIRVGGVVEGDDIVERFSRGIIGCG